MFLYLYLLIDSEYQKHLGFCIIIKFKMINNIRIHVLIAALLLLANVTYAQFSEIGKPFIENFSPKDYKHENQNFSIAQDTNGVMYYGNLDGVMQYDGQSWRIKNFRGKPYLATTKEGRIFVGGYQTFGEIINTPEFEMEYKPLSEPIWKAGYEFDHVEKILRFNKSVVVLASPHVFIIDSLKNVKHLLTSDQDIQIFGDEQPLILLDSGLFKIDIYALDTNSFPNFQGQNIEHVIPFEDKYLIHLEDGDWQVTDTQMNFISEFINKANDIIIKNKFVSGLYLSNGMFAFSTENCGIVIVDNEGGFVAHINQNNGLMNNHIYQLFEDDNQNLWVAMNNGIALLNYSSVFTIFDRDYGIEGGVYDILRFEGRLYLATSEGLFATPLGNKKSDDCMVDGFVPIEGVSLECKRLLNTDGRLFVTNKRGIYEVVNGKAIKKSSLFADGIIRSFEFEDYIYVASPEGLFVFDISDDFERVGRFENINANIRTVAETIEGDLWLGTNYEGVFFVDMPEAFSLDVKTTNYLENNGLPKDHGWIDVYRTHKGTYFSSFKGAFKFKKEEEKFEKQFLIDSIDYRWYYPISEDAQGNLWFSSRVDNAYQRQTGLRYYYASKDSFISVTQPFNIIKDYSIESIYHDGNSVVWFGSFGGLLRFDSKQLNRNNHKPNVNIRMVRFGKDSIINPNFILADQLVKIEYKRNSVMFQVSKPSPQPVDDILFQYQLTGRNNEWSPWQKNYKQQYLGLKEGKYTFKVRCKNINGQISEPKSFSFTIMPPFYRTLFAYVIYFIFIVSFFYMILRYRSYLYAKEKNQLERIIRDKTEEIVIQKERAEDLVKNILPEDTARELQTKGRASRKKYEMVTVLFSDIQGFTEIAEHLNPERLLDELDQYVMKFDNIVGNFNIEKIKTIGDAYMCAGGIPQMNRTNPIDVVLAALQMIKFSKEIQEKSEFDWGIRFGVHTGPVIAGVVGSKKMSYDIWGDTVNIASRMESYSEVGQLNISELTYELVSSYFDCEYRGKIPVKYKGNMNMYFVTGLKDKYAKDEDKVIPNEAFELKLQNIRFQLLEDTILTKLEKGLDRRLYYHDVKHTIDVINQVELIGLGEGIKEEEMILLKTAALFHDLGHTISYIDHEEQGIIFAKDILPKYSYSDNQIEIISELIYATKFPPEPRNKLEEIICDADLDYLGREDFLPSSHNLYLEMFEHGRIKNKEEWNKIQVSFLKTHTYYTETARNARSINKQQQLDKLVGQINSADTEY